MKRFLSRCKNPLIENEPGVAVQSRLFLHDSLLLFHEDLSDSPRAGTRLVNTARQKILIGHREMRYVASGGFEKEIAVHSEH